MTTRKQHPEPRRPSRAGHGWMFLIAGALVLCPSTGVQPAAAQEPPRILTEKGVTDMPPEHIELSETIRKCLIEGGPVYSEAITITIDRHTYFIFDEICPRVHRPEDTDLEIYQTDIVRKRSEREKYFSNKKSVSYKLPAITLEDAQRNGVRVVVCVKNHGKANAKYHLGVGPRLGSLYKTVKWPNALPPQGPLASRCSVVTIPWSVVKDRLEKVRVDNSGSGAVQPGFCVGWAFVLETTKSLLYQDRDMSNHQKDYPKAEVGCVGIPDADS